MREQFNTGLLEEAKRTVFAMSASEAGAFAEGNKPYALHDSNEQTVDTGVKSKGEKDYDTRAEKGEHEHRNGELADRQ